MVVLKVVLVVVISGIEVVDVDEEACCIVSVVLAVEVDPDVLGH